jgi:hypothetical protein
VIIYGVPDVLTTGRRDQLAKRKAATQTKKSRSGGKRVKAEPTLREQQDAVDRARDWLSEHRDYYGYLSRQSGARGAPELARHLRGDMQAKQGRDGSWAEGDLAESTEALWRLLDLGMAADGPAIVRGLDWLYEQREVEGAYGGGCTPGRHEQRMCEHFISGLFSPGPEDEPQEITLANGQTVTSDAGARLLASERALRLALRANAGDARVVASVSGLRGLPLYLEYGGGFTPAVLVGAIQALAWTPGTHCSELEAGLEALADEQGKDGNWPNVEFFFVLETLLEVKHPLARQMLAKAVPRLLEGQHKYGAWGRHYQAAQTWIGLLVLEHALERMKAGKR